MKIKNKLIVAAIIAVSITLLMVIIIGVSWPQSFAWASSLFLLEVWILGRIQENPFPVLDNPVFGIVVCMLLLVYTWWVFLYLPEIGPGTMFELFPIKVPRFLGAALVLLIVGPYFVESAVNIFYRNKT